ncbi:DUF2683 family protein [Pedobacter cryophilus]|uniref:Uncharacterized protein n=1 Tax=Pedobacter cryophilus TaxID=2571271 RepID=A0A4U1C6G4_9SPHI|nr:DUF2683 family protein [Pedobacter cryophilus]TKC00905.1 hypothetical protein FA046_04300 [Pedobacter cryophilus]
MDSYIVHPQNKAQEKAVKAVLEALNVAFEKLNFQAGGEDEICILPPHVVEAVKKSEEQIKNGQFYTYDEVKQRIKNR